MDLEKKENEIVENISMIIAYIQRVETLTLEDVTEFFEVIDDAPLKKQASYFDIISDALIDQGFAPVLFLFFESVSDMQTTMAYINIVMSEMTHDALTWQKDFHILSPTLNNLVATSIDKYVCSTPSSFRDAVAVNNKSLNTFLQAHSRRGKEFDWNTAINKEHSSHVVMTYVQIAERMPELLQVKISPSVIETEKGQLASTIGNWTHVYDGVLGVGNHTSLQRGEFIYRSKFTQKLSNEEKMQLAEVLSLYDGASKIAIDPAQKKIVWRAQKSTSSTQTTNHVAVPRAVVKSQTRPTPLHNAHPQQPVMKPVVAKPAQQPSPDPVSQNAQPHMGVRPPAVKSQREIRSEMIRKARPAQQTQPNPSVAPVQTAQPSPAQLIPQRTEKKPVLNSSQQSRRQVVTSPPGQASKQADTSQAPLHQRGLEQRTQNQKSTQSPTVKKQVVPQREESQKSAQKPEMKKDVLQKTELSKEAQKNSIHFGRISEPGRPSLSLAALKRKEASAQPMTAQSRDPQVSAAQKPIEQTPPTQKQYFNQHKQKQTQAQPQPAQPSKISDNKAPKESAGAGKISFSSGQTFPNEVKE